MKIHAHTCSDPPGIHIKVVMNLFFYNVICKNFDTGIYLHVPSRLPKVGLHEVAKRWPKSRFYFILLHKSQRDVSREGGLRETSK